MASMMEMNKMPNGKYNPKTSLLRYRVAAYLLTFLIIWPSSTPVFAMVMSDSQVHADMERDPQFQRVSHSDYQYKAHDYIEAAVAPSQTIESFYSKLESEHIVGLGEVIFVPIGVGDITIFIPTYNKYKSIGSAAVQSRYVRTQINAMLGRNLIDADRSGFADEQAQINSLYNAAFSYIKNTSSLQFGDKLNRDQDASGLSQDMIWPEVRRINGEDVVVPILYLTESTVSDRKVNSTQVELLGDVTLDNLSVTGVDIQFGRQTFLNVANGISNNGGNFTSSGELKIMAGGSFTNLSGKIETQGSLYLAATSIVNQTIVHRYENEYGQSYRLGEIAQINSVNGDITLRSYSDITFAGSGASAPNGEITLAADGNIYLGALPLYESDQQHRNNSRSSVSYLQSSLTAEQTIQLIANGEIVIDAAEIVSDEGHIELLAGLGITVVDALAENRSYFKGKFGKKSVTESVYQTVAIRSLLDAGKGVKLHSEFGDITLRAADISTADGTQVTASNGAVNLLMTTETDHYSYSSVKKGLFTVKTENRGHNIETGVPNTIVGGFAVEALSGVNVEYEGDPNLTLDEQVAVLAGMPGLEWMAEVRANSPEVDWQAIQLQYEEWNESSTSLSAAAMALISIAVMVATGGAGAFGTSLLGSSASAALGTSLTAAVGAASLSLITAATIASSNALLNGDDPFEAAFETLTDEDTLKSAAIAAVTAGAIDALDAEFFDASQYASDSAMVATTTVTDVVTGLESTVTTLSLTGQLVQALTHATVQAGIESVLVGGEFEDILVQSLTQQGINALGEYIAGEIGDAARANDWDRGYQLIAHAASGCVLGSLTSAVKDTDLEASCVSAGAGAVVGEIIGMYRDETLYDDVKHSLSEDALLEDYLQLANELILRGYNIASISAAFGAFLAGLDPQLASQYAGVAYLFNAASNSTKDVAYRWKDENGVTHYGNAFPSPSSETVDDLTLLEGNSDVGFVETNIEEERQWLSEQKFVSEQERQTYEDELRQKSLACIRDGSLCPEITLYQGNHEPPPQIDGGEFYGDYITAQDHMRAQMQRLSEVGGVVDDSLVVSCEFVGFCSVGVVTEQYRNGQLTVSEYAMGVGLAIVPADRAVDAFRGLARSVRRIDGPNCTGSRCGSAGGGVYSSTAPLGDEFPELQGVNPHYIEGVGSGVNTNCVSCTNAAVDRLIGRDAGAIANPSSGYAGRNDLLPSAPFGFQAPTTPASVRNTLLEEGNGSVGVVLIEQSSGVTHAIVGVNRSGTVSFIDPQLGVIVDLEDDLTVVLGLSQ